MSPWLSELLLSSQSDDRLVALVRAGHDRAFTAIVERYRKPLHAFACRAYGPGRADDIVQQTFLQALSALRAGTEVTHLRGWLHQILRHAAIRSAEPRDVLTADDEWEAAPGGDSVTDAVERRLEAQGALAEIARLPPRQRDAFVRTAIQGRSRTEVADALGLSEGAVRQLVHRARATVRAATTALIPAPLARWLAGPPSRGGGRLLELMGGAGAASAGGIAAKFGALVASGIVATGVLAPHNGGAPSRQSPLAPSAVGSQMANGGGPMRFVDGAAPGIPTVVDGTVGPEPRTARRTSSPPGRDAVGRGSRYASHPSPSRGSGGAPAGTGAPNRGRVSSRAGLGSSGGNPASSGGGRGPSGRDAGASGGDLGSSGGDPASSGGGGPGLLEAGTRGAATASGGDSGADASGGAGSDTALSAVTSESASSTPNGEDPGVQPAAALATNPDGSSSWAASSGADGDTANSANARDLSGETGSTSTSGL